MKKIIIFCQAPADIKYALTIYERNIKNSIISIFCINVEGMHKFIKSLDLDLGKLEFIPYPSKFNIKNIKSILAVKKQIYHYYKKFFHSLVGYEIYYFSSNFDWITFYMLKRIKSNNEIIFINHYDDKVTKNYCTPKISLRSIYTRLMFRFITCIWFDFYSFNRSLIIRFPYERFNIPQKKNNILEPDIYKKYSYKVENTKMKSVLMLEMDYKKVNIFSNYKEITIKIIKILKKRGLKIFLKPHPRLGYSEFLNDYNIAIIDGSIPAEFIDETSFDYILGISSSALAYFANRKKVKVISMMYVYQYNDENTKKRAFEYIRDISSNINFIKDLDNF